MKRQQVSTINPEPSSTCNSHALRKLLADCVLVQQMQETMVGGTLHAIIFPSGTRSQTFVLLLNLSPLSR